MLSLQLPKQLFTVLVNPKITKRSINNGYCWFTSKEGEQEYRSATNLSEKVQFFYDYLVARYNFSIGIIKLLKSGGRYEYDCENFSREKITALHPLGILYRIAFIMADAMVNSKLEFGGFPNVMNSDLNPLVAFIASDAFIKSETFDENDIVSQLICALHKEEYHKISFTQLTPPNADGTFSDMYKIEREIIWAFCTKTTDKLNIGPFSFNICKPNNDDDNDDDSEE